MAVTVVAVTLLGAGACTSNGDSDGDGDVPAPTSEPRSDATTTTAVADPRPRLDDVAPLPTSIEDSLYPDLGAAGLDVTHYDVELAVDDELAASGTVTMSIAATEDLSRVAVDARSLAVKAVTLDGDEVDFTHDEPELLVTPDEVITAGARFELAVTYVDDPEVRAEADQLGPGWIRADGYAYTLNEPEAGRDWLPSLDHPSDKATWRFSITPPPGAIAVANGIPTVRPIEGDDGPWVWEVTDPMATYLVQVLVGDLTLVETTSASGVDLISAVLRDEADAHRSFIDQIGAQLAFFEDTFGPYPFPSYGVAIIDEERGLAIEHQTRSLFTADTVGSDAAAHELAHQWFGDAVTPARWGDIWLAESLATYGQWLWSDHVGERSVDEAAADALMRRRADGGPATSDPTVEELFGFNVYDGGALVVHALRREMGDDDFFALLRRWLAEYAGTSQRTAAFTDVASEVAGRDLRSFFDAWLHAEDLPDALPD